MPHDGRNVLSYHSVMVSCHDPMFALLFRVSIAAGEGLKATGSSTERDVGEVSCMAAN